MCYNETVMKKTSANKHFDAAALGELLIDLTEYGQSGQGNPLWEANPGGAPCNVLAMLSKLGKRTAFIGKVGSDVYGRQLRRTLEEAGIDAAGLRTDPAVPTTLAVVARLENGDRDFAFYRDPGADMMLREDELPMPLLADCRIFHFGTLSLTHPGIRAATETAVRAARDAGALLSFDPNLRPPLWRSQEEARAAIAWGLGVCRILKIADNELLFMTGETNPDKGAAALRKKYPQIRLLTVTAGAEGSYCYYEDRRVFEPAYLLGGTVDTTGAGDIFCACVLKDVLENGTEGRDESGLRAMLRFANAAAYLVTTKKGALRSVPEPEQIRSILEKTGRC